MKHGERALLIRSTLAEAPCTASELAAVLELPRQIAAGWLGMMRSLGFAEVIGRIENTDTGRSVGLYRLTPKGAAVGQIPKGRPKSCTPALKRSELRRLLIKAQERIVELEAEIDRTMIECVRRERERT